MEDEPRCLYFDLDAKAEESKGITEEDVKEFKKKHCEIMGILRREVGGLFQFDVDSGSASVVGDTDTSSEDANLGQATGGRRRLEMVVCRKC